MTFIGEIAIRRASKAPMEVISSTLVSVENGLQGDFPGGTGRTSRKRQVTLLGLPQWGEVCDRVGEHLNWTLRRANFLVEGVKFGPQHKHQLVYIGEDVVLEILGETTPCEGMDIAHDTLKRALTSSRYDWPGGVYCKVIQGGIVRQDSNVIFRAPSAP